MLVYRPESQPLSLFKWATSLLLLTQTITHLCRPWSRKLKKNPAVYDELKAFNWVLRRMIMIVMFDLRFSLSFICIRYFWLKISTIFLCLSCVCVCLWCDGNQMSPHPYQDWCSLCNYRLNWPPWFAPVVITEPVMTSVANTGVRLLLLHDCSPRPAVTCPDELFLVHQVKYSFHVPLSGPLRSGIVCESTFCTCTRNTGPTSAWCAASPSVSPPASTSTCGWVAGGRHWKTGK